MCKVCQQLFRTLAILNVGRRTVPSHDLSSLVPQRHDAAQKPPILPVSAAEAQLLLDRLTTGYARDQSSLNSIQIVGMNGNLPDVLWVFQLRQPGIFNPASIQKLNVVIGSSDPRHRRNGLKGFAKFSL